MSRTKRGRRSAEGREKHRGYVWLHAEQLQRALARNQAAGWRRVRAYRQRPSYLRHRAAKRAEAIERERERVRAVEAWVASLVEESEQRYLARGLDDDDHPETAIADTTPMDEWVTRKAEGRQRRNKLRWGK